MYGFYLQDKLQQRQACEPVSESFLCWHRSREYDSENNAVLYRGGRHQQTSTLTQVVACRFWYELTDGYWGQYTLVNLPHADPKYLLPRNLQHLFCMQNFAGMLEYLSSWHWGTDSGIIIAADAYEFHEKALPLRVDDVGAIMRIGAQRPGELVFPDVEHAHDYMVSLAKRDLQYRGFRDDRVSTFEYKQQANYLLFKKVRDCSDKHEYECLRQSWDTVNRPKYVNKVWSKTQLDALAVVEKAVSHDDEEARRNSYRWLYVKGAPGSGKSAVIMESAMRLCKTMKVLIVCPTGFLVFAFKSRLPDIPGIENIRVDTIQGVLNYKRPGADSKVRWSPPSALRSIDAILIDEASQYEDVPWERFYTCVREQPHDPFCMVVADFQQLQPVVSGGRCKEMCELMQSVELLTVYRSTDPEHLVFLNRIRTEQPDRECLYHYFGDRHWEHLSLSSCVQRGMQMGEEQGHPFTWLTTTNRGTSLVCEAALQILGIGPAELAKGYMCDPTQKSELRILARPGIMIRLTRNDDKQRGFVNGARAEITESLRGNGVFIAKLTGTGNYVLVHPREEDGARFLPCVYGYATTIRRAQGADLDHGCLYFDHIRPAARGYGYVGASRFKTRVGCFLFGKMRRTDFLPVGEPKDGEVLQRGYHSVDSEDDEGRGIERLWENKDGEDSDAWSQVSDSCETGNPLKDFEPMPGMAADT